MLVSGSKVVDGRLLSLSCANSNGASIMALSGTREEEIDLVFQAVQALCVLRFSIRTEYDRLCMCEQAAL